MTHSRATYIFHEDIPCQSTEVDILDSLDHAMTSIESFRLALSRQRKGEACDGKSREEQPTGDRRWDEEVADVMMRGASTSGCRPTLKTRMPGRRFHRLAQSLWRGLRHCAAKTLEDDDLAKDKPLAAAEMHAQRCANMDIKGCSTGPAWGEEDEGSDARVPAKDTFPSLPTSPSAQPVQDNSSSDEGTSSTPSPVDQPGDPPSEDARSSPEPLAARDVSPQNLDHHWQDAAACEREAAASPPMPLHTMKAILGVAKGANASLHKEVRRMEEEDRARCLGLGRFVAHDARSERMQVARALHEELSREIELRVRKMELTWLARLHDYAGQALFRREF